MSDLEALDGLLESEGGGFGVGVGNRVGVVRKRRGGDGGDGGGGETAVAEKAGRGGGGGGGAEEEKAGRVGSEGGDD